MTSHVCQLIEVVAKNISMARTSDSAKAEDVGGSSDNVIGQTLLRKLSNEWREFFSVSASGNLLRLWSQVAGEIPDAYLH
jgi:hypothetical protein